MSEEPVSAITEEVVPVVEEPAKEIDLDTRFAKLKEEVMEMYKPKEEEIEVNKVTPMSEESIKRLMQEHTMTIRKELENASPQSHRVVKKEDPVKDETFTQLKEMFAFTQQYEVDKRNSYVKESMVNISNKDVRDLILDTVKDMRYSDAKSKVDELTKLYSMTDTNKPYHMYNNGKTEEENIKIEVKKSLAKMYGGGGGFSDYDPKP